MSRHVIKGRGKNQGKYLCYARLLQRQAGPLFGDALLRQPNKPVRMSMGQLAVIAGMRPMQIWARVRRGLTAEQAVFGTKVPT